MHAIVEIAGKQFRVASNDKVKVPLLAAKEGEKVNFDKVHMFEDDKGKVTIGSPLVSNMAVDATVLKHDRDAKIIVFKKKRRKGYQKKNGHRQDYSLIEINSIGAAKASAKKATKAEKPAPVKAEAKPVKKAAPKKAATKATETKKAPAAKKTTTVKKATKSPAAPKKAEAAAKPKATKSTAKPKPAAKKAEPKPKAKED